MDNHSSLSRRKFIRAGAASALVLSAAPSLFSQSLNKDLSVQNVIDKIILKCTGEPLKETVDTVKTGDAKQPVKGIAVTFLATCAIIEKAVEKGLQFYHYP